MKTFGAYLVHIVLTTLCVIVLGGLFLKHDEADAMSRINWVLKEYPLLIGLGAFIAIPVTQMTASHERRKRELKEEAKRAQRSE